ncbi:MAG: hypothetical protein A2202_06030 [Bdellovibrionales bacterium RIFOXYA1_FULL_36_14]|nr:MAG: hypothetical protein A2202_06030 [Bdellovibrionales bacterium RIFOXYA1_FULL_36_14]
MNKIFFFILIFFHRISYCLGSESLQEGLWSLKYHFLNFVIVVMICYYLLKDKLNIMFSKEHNQFIKEVKENEDHLQEIKIRLKKAEATLSNMNNIIAELESKTKESIENYLQLKKEQLTERERQLKTEISQRKDNLEISLVQKLYLGIMNNIIDNTKKDIKFNNELKSKIENKLIDNQL